APGRQLAEAQVGEVVDVEVDVHRVDGDERGQDGAAGLARLHDVADRHQGPPDVAADRGADLGEAEVELRRLERGLRPLDGGPGLYLVDRRDPAGEVGVVGDVPLQGQADRNRQRGRCVLVRGGLAATGQTCGEQGCGE